MPTMLLNQRLGDSQAKPCAFVHPIGLIANLVEFVEDKFVLFLGDAISVIFDGDLD